MQMDTETIAMAGVIFEKTALIIAILGQKMVNWHLNKVVPSTMCNYNFEAIN